MTGATNTTLPMIGHILDMVTRTGCAILPLHAGAKSPAVSSWGKEHDEWPTRDAEKIRAHWRQNPGHNYGVVAGPDVLILDEDNKGGIGGRTSLAFRELCGDELPDALMVATPNGCHHYMKTHVQVSASVNRVGSGLDVRCGNSYAVGPGSVVDGKMYEIAADLPLTPAPGWLIDACGKPRERRPGATAPAVQVEPDRARARAVRYLLNDAPLNHDPDAYKVACKLKDIGVSEADAVALMVAHWDPRCDPPRTDDTVTPTRNAYRYGLDAPGVAAPEADFDAVAEDPTAEKHPAPLGTGSDIELARVALEDLRGACGDVVYADGAFWRYGSGCWSSIAQDELHRRLHAYDGRGCVQGPRVRLGKQRIASILHEAAMMAAKPDFFAERRAGINCASGFIAFDGKGNPSLLPHDPAHRARHVLPGQWAPGAEWRRDGSLLGRLLDGCFLGDDDKAEKIAFLGEVFGAAALGYATKLMKPKAIILHGDSAENGKSQVLDAMRGLLPHDAVTAIPPGKFGNDTMVVQLAGKLLNATDELSGANAIASDAFKAVVTGDMVTARDVYKPAISFQPVALQVHATNTLPPFAGGFDRGVRRRLAMLKFNRTVPPNERIEHIGARIAKEESDLLLAFAAEGAQQLIARRYFSEPPSSKDALLGWVLGADPVSGWMHDCAEIDPDADRVPQNELYRHFRCWAMREGFDMNRLPKPNTFAQRVLAHDARISNPRDSRGRYLSAIRLLQSDFGDAPVSHK